MEEIIRILIGLISGKKTDVQPVYVPANANKR